MAVTGGYQHYTCDRCGKEAYLADDSAEASTWSTVNRVSVDKATSAQPLTSYTMCASCRDDYIAFDRPQDDAFATFMAQPARERAQKQADADAAKAQADADAKAQRQREIDDAVNAQKQEDQQAAQKLDDEIGSLRDALDAARAENVRLKADAAKQVGQTQQDKDASKTDDGPAAGKPEDSKPASDKTDTPAAPAEPANGTTGSKSTDDTPAGAEASDSKNTDTKEGE